MCPSAGGCSQEVEGRAGVLPRVTSQICYSIVLEMKCIKLRELHKPKPLCRKKTSELGIQHFLVPIKAKLHLSQGNIGKYNEEICHINI
jgi:hypothetical protein